MPGQDKQETAILKRKKKRLPSLIITAPNEGAFVTNNVDIYSWSMMTSLNATFHIFLVQQNNIWHTVST